MPLSQSLSPDRREVRFNFLAQVCPDPLATLIRSTSATDGLDSQGDSPHETFTACRVYFSPQLRKLLWRHYKPNPPIVTAKHAWQDIFKSPQIAWRFPGTEDHKLRWQSLLEHFSDNHHLTPTKSWLLHRHMSRNHDSGTHCHSKAIPPDSYINSKQILRKRGNR